MKAGHSRTETATRINWAWPRKWDFDFGIEHCSHIVGSDVKIIAATDEPSVIAKIIARLGLPTSHVRCAIPASLAVQSSLPGLPFAV